MLEFRMIKRRNIVKALTTSVISLGALAILNKSFAARGFIIKQEDICDSNMLSVHHEIVNDLTEYQIAAADDVVQMLNVGPDGSRYRYDPMLSKVDVGGRVLWKATTKGHNVEFMEAPNNLKFKSKMHKSAGYNFSVPGIYTYKCTPHLSTGMVGVVVVGNDLSNMDQVMNSKKYHGQAKDLIQNILKEL